MGLCLECISSHSATQLRVQLEEDNPALDKCVCPCPPFARCVIGMTQRLEVDKHFPGTELGTEKNIQLPRAVNVSLHQH